MVTGMRVQLVDLVAEVVKQAVAEELVLPVKEIPADKVELVLTVAVLVAVAAEKVAVAVQEIVGVDVFLFPVDPEHLVQYREAQ
jgi:hypothetical protein